MSVPKDNVAYLREWAADIRKHSGKSVDADRCDAIADEIAHLREIIQMWEARFSILKRWINETSAAGLHEEEGK